MSTLQGVVEPLLGLPLIVSSGFSKSLKNMPFLALKLLKINGGYSEVDNDFTQYLCGSHLLKTAGRSL
jgi:hypothetical protein